MVPKGILDRHRVPLLTLYAVFLHARIDWTYGPVGRVIASPAFHRWHHSQEPEAIDKNFSGLFAFWDVLFGTYYHPHSIEYPATGLASGEKLVTPWQAIAWPFLRWSGRTSKL